jgi:hypothetical protein
MIVGSTIGCQMGNFATDPPNQFVGALGPGQPARREVSCADIAALRRVPEEIGQIPEVQGKGFEERVLDCLVIRRVRSSRRRAQSTTIETS